MSLFEQLKQSYLNEIVQPYGEVVVVPTRAFQNEWKEQLEAEGIKIFSSSYGMQSAFFLRKASATEKSSIQQVARQDNPEKQVKEKKPWTSEERNKLKELLSQGLSAKEIAARLGKSVWQVGGAIRYLPRITPLPKSRSSSTEKTNPQLELDNPADADLVKEYLSAISLLYPSHRRVCRLLLREAANVMEKTP